MRTLYVAVGVAVALAAGFVASILLASEGGEEIVVLRTFDAGGSPVETRLWVVDEGGSAWLRSGVPGSGWLGRIEANPRVELERSGRTARMRAVPVRDPVGRDRIHALMREKYGFADVWVSLIRDAAGSVAVRLEPAGGE
ncbi:MAG: nitroreductase/quinone reductase family protein [Myxococcales bacterium]|nr:nitroreductase/quinone reductase family protein [Myxococcales bacterium]